MINKTTVIAPPPVVAPPMGMGMGVGYAAPVDTSAIKLNVGLEICKLVRGSLQYRAIDWGMKKSRHHTRGASDLGESNFPEVSKLYILV